MSFLLSVIRGEPEGRGNILTLLRILTLLFTSYSIKAQTYGNTASGFFMSDHRESMAVFDRSQHNIHRGLISARLLSFCTSRYSVITSRCPLQSMEIVIQGRDGTDSTMFIHGITKH